MFVKTHQIGHSEMLVREDTAGLGVNASLLLVLVLIISSLCGVGGFT